MLSFIHSRQNYWIPTMLQAPFHVLGKETNVIPGVLEMEEVLKSCPILKDTT